MAPKLARRGRAFARLRSPLAFACVHPPGMDPHTDLRNGGCASPVTSAGSLVQTCGTQTAPERPKRTHPPKLHRPHPRPPPLRPSPAPPPNDNRTPSSEHAAPTPTDPHKALERHPPAALQRSRRRLTAPNRRLTHRRRRELSAFGPGDAGPGRAHRSRAGGRLLRRHSGPSTPFGLFSGCGVAVSGLAARRGGSWPADDEGPCGRGLIPPRAWAIQLRARL